MVPQLRRNGTVARTRLHAGVAARERKIPLKRTIGKHDLSFDLFTSRRMSVVKQRGTGAEVRVRAILSRLGIRFRVDNADLPGSPDLANRSRRWAIFVHGCFWHAHSGCRKATLPKRNRAYWIEKFATNKARDAVAIRRLRTLGYEVLRVWECQLAPSRLGSLERRLAAARERLISARPMQAG